MTFTCELCGGVFEKGQSEEEARSETVANGWGDIPADDMAIVCDDCYEQMIALDPPAAFNAREALP